MNMQAYLAGYLYKQADGMPTSFTFTPGLNTPDAMGQLESREDRARRYAQARGFAEYKARMAQQEVAEKQRKGQDFGMLPATAEQSQYNQYRRRMVGTPLEGMGSTYFGILGAPPALPAGNQGLRTSIVGSRSAGQTAVDRTRAYMALHNPKSDNFIRERAVDLGARRDATVDARYRWQQEIAQAHAQQTK